MNRVSILVSSKTYTHYFLSRCTVNLFFRILIVANSGHTFRSGEFLTRLLDVVVVVTLE